MSAVEKLSAVDHLQGARQTDSAVVRPSLLSLMSETGVAIDELRAAAEEAMNNGEPFGDVVLRRELIDEEGLAKLLAQQWGLPSLDQDALELAVVERETLPLEQARELAACVIDLGEGATSVVVAEPTGERLSELRLVLGDDAAFAVVTEASLERLLDELAAEPAQAPLAESDDEEEVETAEPMAATDAPDDTVLAELEAATAALAALGAQAERVTSARRAIEGELTELRDELARLNDEREQEQALAREREEQFDRDLTEIRSEVSRLSDQLEHEQSLAREREEELDRQREHNHAIKTKLGDLLGEFDG
jgi:MshEN domain